MRNIALPDELNLDNSDSIALFYYQSSNEISKQHIILNKNIFSFLAEGSKEVFFDNASCAIENDRFLLMRSGHCLMTEKLSSENRHYASILLFFSNEVLHRFIKKHGITTAAHDENNSVHTFSYDPFINGFTNSLLELLKLPKTTREKLMEAKFEELMLYLTASVGTHFIHTLTHQSSSGKEQKFVETIENNRLNKLTVKELAFLCNMSISTFKREFEKQFQSPPSRWFQGKRLEHAAFLLKDKSIRPSDIFEETGYESLSNFITAFKKKFGTTPKQYQNN